MELTVSQTTLSPLMTLMRMAIIAKTSKIWIIFPIVSTKAPITHPIKRITAMIYNKLFIKVDLRLLFIKAPVPHATQTDLNKLYTLIAHRELLVIVYKFSHLVCKQGKILILFDV